MSTTEPTPLAVVTGASSGIGFELAKVFARNGFDLVVAAEDAELTQAARELEGLGTHVEALQADLARPEGVEELAIDDATMAEHRDPADKVAEQGFKAMMNGEEKVVAGSFLNKVQAKANAVIPDAVTSRLHGKLVQKDSEHEKW